MKHIYLTDDRKVKELLDKKSFESYFVKTSYSAELDSVGQIINSCNIEQK